MAEGGDEIQGPRDYEKAVSAAYLRILGNNQGDAATAAGVGERTLARWETCSWWGDILREAEDRWLSGLVSAARSALMDGMTPDNASLALKILERRVPELAPPKLQHEHTGADGEPMEVKVGDLRERFTRRITGIASRIGAGAGHSGTNGDGTPGS